MIEIAWGDTARYGRIAPAPAERTPEEQDEIERLEACQTQLAELDDEEWTGETLTESEVPHPALDRDLQSRLAHPCHRPPAPPLDWAERYSTTPVLIEAFVETPRCTGVSYRALGCLHVGTTQGRGRYDRAKAVR